MKQYLPYNILLVIAIAATGLMVFYNLALRETFAVTVAYTLPAVARAEPQPVEASEGEPKYSDGEEAEEDDFYESFQPEDRAAASVAFPLDLNRATERELCFIPQVGSVTAQRIVQYRDVLGAYTSLAQLKEIKGIGDKTFETISAYLVINDIEPSTGGQEGLSLDQNGESSREN